MFNKKQTEIVKEALFELDSFETKKIIENQPISFEFSREFEERADDLKRRVSAGIKSGVKRILVACIAAVIAITAAVGIIAGSDGMKTIRFGNNIDLSGGRMITDLPYPVGDEKTLDIGAMIIEAELPVPEGFECTYFDPYGNGYSIYYSDSANGYKSLSINIVEVYPESNIKFEHNGEMKSFETPNGLTVYNYDGNYMMKGYNYLATIWGKKNDFETEDALAIFDAIDKMLSAPVRTFEEIYEESLSEPNPMMRDGWVETSGVLDYNLDFSTLKYQWLSVPEGYKLCKVQGYARATYQKNIDGIYASDLIIEMVDLTVDPYIHSLYENTGEPIEAGGIKLYKKSVPFTDDHYGAVAEYVYVDETYAVIFTLRTTPKFDGEILPSAEEIAIIADEINNYTFSEKS